MCHNNKRWPRHSITIHHLKTCDEKELRERWKKLKQYLEKIGIIGLKVAEITRDKRGDPTDRLHYHIAIDGNWTEKELRSIFRNCCLASGHEEKDFRIDYRLIDNFVGWLCYVLKYKRPDKLIMFRTGTGIRKIEAIGAWYLDEYGKKISRTKAWKYVQARQEASSEKQLSKDDQTPSPKGGTK